MLPYVDERKTLSKLSRMKCNWLKIRKELVVPVIKDCASLWLGELKKKQEKSLVIWRMKTKHTFLNIITPRTFNGPVSIRLVTLDWEWDDEIYSEMCSAKWMLPSACFLIYSASLVGWSSGNVLHLYSGGATFKYHSRKFFVVSLSASRQVPG
jgi:hypothetical protein